MRLRQFDHARDSLRHAIELTDDSRRPPLQFQLGQACRELYRGSGSELDFRIARDAFSEAQVDPALEAQALDAYGFLFMEKGHFQNYERAYETYARLREKHPDFESDRIAAVIELLEKLTGRKPADTPSGG
jgi:tetratricopeptide (TPR) repeat protein